MTEAAHQMCAHPLDGPWPPSSVGVGAFVDVATMDGDGRLLAAGETGEVVVRGENVTRGYHNNPAANAAAFTNGWFRTGDLGAIDERGFLRLVGRLKELINRGGEKFSALDIESAIASYPDVAAVAVTAVPDERLGEAVGAWLVLTPGAEWSGPERIVEHLETVRLARQKIPVRWTVVSSLPTTASGKVQKNKLAEWDQPS